MAAVIIPHFPHSTQFSGGVCYRLSKASRREDLQVEEPVACWDCASFDFHPTLPGMLSAPLVGHQVVPHSTELCGRSKGLRG